MFVCFQKKTRLKIRSFPRGETVDKNHSSWRKNMVRATYRRSDVAHVTQHRRDAARVRYVCMIDSHIVRSFVVVVSIRSKEWTTVAGTQENPENGFGRAGASINAKTPSKKAPFEMAFLMHALYGLQRFPGYLAKWRDEDLDMLEKLSTVLTDATKRERDNRRRRAHFLREYKSLHSDLATISTSFEKLMSPNCVTWLKGDRKKRSIASVLNVREEHPSGIFSFDLLSKDACQMLREEMGHFLKYRNEYEKQHGPVPGTLRERLVLRDLNLSAFSSFLFERIVKPLVKEIFGPSTLASLDFHHDYFVGYGKNEIASRNIIRNALIPHTDDSEITLNVGLSGSFNGGKLCFMGVRDENDGMPLEFWPDHVPKTKFVYAHREGRAIVHLGKNVHEVKPVMDGERHVLIMWCRSIKNHRAKKCPCCMEFNRSDCVCLPKYN